MFSSLSRRRLLGWAAAGAASPLAGSAAEMFGRKDPRILTQTFRRATDIALDERSIRIEPIVAEQAGKPTPPDFAPFLGKALEWALPGSELLVGNGAESGVGALIQGKWIYSIAWVRRACG
ncbi:MAG: hypothetical protein R2724_27230 [Bryobacterales bacterium]